MQKIKRVLKIAGFLCLLFLACVGIGIPIPMFTRDRTESRYEQVEEDIKLV